MTGHTSLHGLVSSILGRLHASASTVGVESFTALGSSFLARHNLDSEESLMEILEAVGETGSKFLHSSSTPRFPGLAVPSATPRFGLSPPPLVAVAYHSGFLTHVCRREAGKDGMELTPSERPDRALAIAGVLAGLGLLQACARLLVREATANEISLITSEQHRVWVEANLALASAAPTPVTAHFSPPDLYWCPGTGSAARLALGACIEAVEALCRGVCQRALCIVRPPGHHAHSEVSRGFCIFNNVGGAVLSALNDRVAASGGRPTLSRVLIVDLDVHHGDGTEALFYEDPRVLTFSLHRYDAGGYYPCTGHPERVGEGVGLGYNCNVGLDGDWHGDRELCAVVDAVLAPLARAFDPQLVVVSLGCDSGRGDPLGDWDITPSGYAYALSTLTLLGAPIAVVLEGGYNCHTLASTVADCTRVLLGEQCPSPLCVGERGVGVLPERAVLAGGDGGCFFGMGTREGDKDREHLRDTLDCTKVWRENVGSTPGSSPCPARRLGLRPSVHTSIAKTISALRPHWRGVFGM